VSRLSTAELKSLPIVTAKWCAIDAVELGGDEGTVLALEITIENSARIIVWSGAPARDLEAWTVNGTLGPTVMDWLAKKAGGPR
jgi:hypothetical protein